MEFHRFQENYEIQHNSIEFAKYNSIQWNVMDFNQIEWD